MLCACHTCGIRNKQISDTTVAMGFVSVVRVIHVIEEFRFRSCWRCGELHGVSSGSSPGHVRFCYTWSSRLLQLDVICNCWCDRHRGISPIVHVLDEELAGDDGLYHGLPIPRASLVEHDVVRDQDALGL
jgi:hypothetical protein